MLTRWVSPRRLWLASLYEFTVLVAVVVAVVMMMEMIPVALAFTNRKFVEDRVEESGRGEREKEKEMEREMEMEMEMEDGG